MASGRKYVNTRPWYAKRAVTTAAPEGVPSGAGQVNARPVADNTVYWVSGLPNASVTDWALTVWVWVGVAADKEWVKLYNGSFPSLGAGVASGVTLRFEVGGLAEDDLVYVQLVPVGGGGSINLRERLA